MTIIEQQREVLIKYIPQSDHLTPFVSNEKLIRDLKVDDLFDLLDNILFKGKHNLIITQLKQLGFMNATVEKVKAILVDKGLYASVKEININDPIRGNENMDSLDVIEVIIECEREFNVLIPDTSVETFQSISDLCEWIAIHTRK